MSEDRLSKKIHTFLHNWKTDKVHGWVGAVRRDLEEMHTDQETVHKRDKFRAAVEKFRGFQEDQTNKRSGIKWSEERKRAHSEKMKEFWRKIKEKK